MTGIELYNTIQKCDNVCFKCLAYRPKSKYDCPKKFNEAWRDWAREQHKMFEVNLNEEQRQVQS